MYDEEGAPASDLEGATATAFLRRVSTPPDESELPMVAVDLDAEAATATLTLSADQTQALSPPAGEPFGLVEIVVKVVTDDALVHFHGPGQLQVWGRF